MNGRSAAKSFPWLAGLLVSTIGLIGTPQAGAQQLCYPSFTFKRVQLSERQAAPARKWSALVGVDASGCAAKSSGYFEIVLSRHKDTGPYIEWRQEFMWLGFDWAPRAVNIEVDLGAEDAVDRFRFDTITPCPCASETARAAQR
jgi:hypothetical protein